MLLGFNQVDGILRSVHRIEDADQAMFRARLRHLKRIGLNTSPAAIGRRPNYTVGDLFRLGCAMELIDLHCTPESAVAFVESSWSVIAKTLRTVAAEIRRGIEPPDHYLFLLPNALRIRLEHAPAKYTRLNYVTGEHLHEVMRERRFRGHVAMSVTVLVEEVETGAQRLGIEPDRILDELLKMKG